MGQFCDDSQKASPERSWRWWLAVGLAAGTGVAAGRAIIGPVSVVDGASMAPTYPPGAVIHATALSGPLRRGDIILLDDGRKQCALKRIVGLPGESVHLWRGCVFVNRQMLTEPYLPHHTFTSPSQETGLYAFALGSEQYFVLGDNRGCSEDSRIYGPVDRRQIKSRVPLPEDTLRPRFAQYTLPAPGKRTIRPL